MTLLAGWEEGWAGTRRKEVRTEREDVKGTKGTRAEENLNVAVYVSMLFRTNRWNEWKSRQSIDSTEPNIHTRTHTHT